MNHVLVVAPPKIKIRNANDAAWQMEMDAFYAMFDELIQKYENQHVVIYQGKVVMSGDEKIELWKRAIEQLGSVPFFIHLVSRKPERVRRLPSSLYFGRRIK